MGRNVLRSSVDNASFSIVFQIVFRCITFVLNAFIIRHVGQDVLGIMNVRLLLLESTLVFLSREPLLKACLSDTKSHNWVQVINQIWASVPISATLGLVLTYVWINLLSTTEEKYITQYQYGCYAILISCIVDQITHSVIIVSQSFCFVRLKVVLDTIYVVVRTTIFVVLVLRSPDQAINAFSAAQLISALVLCSLYFAFFWWYIRGLNSIRSGVKESKMKWAYMYADMQDFKFNSIRDFLPKVTTNDKFVNKDLMILTVSFAKQCVVKQMLTEGEKYVMTVSPVLTFSQQSMYDIVNNLGSLAARFVFRPIEESAYFYFTQTIKRDVALMNQERKNVVESATVLSQLLQVVTSIGLVVVVFGHTYSHTLLYLYGGHVLTDNYLPTTLLKCHCFAVLLLAINGVLEAYVFATMDTKQLDRYNYIMVGFSVTFLLISYLLTNFLGPIGFIIANCVNMTGRIVHSIYFINNQFKDSDMNPLDGLRHRRNFLVALGVSGIITKISEIYVYDASLVAHVAIGAVCYLTCTVVWAYENNELLMLGVARYKRRMSIKVD